MTGSQRFGYYAFGEGKSSGPITKCCLEPSSSSSSWDSHSKVQTLCLYSRQWGWPEGLGSSFSHPCHGLLRKLSKITTLAPKYQRFPYQDIFWWEPKIFFYVLLNPIYTWKTFFTLYKFNIYYVICQVAVNCQLSGFFFFKTKWNKRKHFKKSIFLFKVLSKNIWILELFTFGAGVVIWLCLRNNPWHW